MRIGTVAETPDEAAALQGGRVAVPFLETHFAVLLARTIVVATKLGVLEALADGSGTAAGVAAACDLHPAATAKLLNALLGAGYVTTTADGRYALTPSARLWLLKESASSIRDYVLELEHCEWKWSESYEQFVRTGTPVHIHRAMTAAQWRLYQHGMRALARLSASEVAERMPVPSRPARMLDLAGSHGYFSVMLCRRHPTLSATVIDLPGAVEYAAPMIAEEGMSDRISHRAADATACDLGVAEYDLIFLSHAAHHFDAATNQRIAERAARALRPGGYFVIQDGIRPAAAGEAGQLALLLDLFCAAVSHSGQWTLAEMAAWQTAAGLLVEEPILLRTAPGVGLQPARKI